MKKFIIVIIRRLTKGTKYSIANISVYDDKEAFDMERRLKKIIKGEVEKAFSDRIDMDESGETYLHDIYVFRKKIFVPNIDKIIKEE